MRDEIPHRPEAPARSVCIRRSRYEIEAPLAVCEGRLPWGFASPTSATRIEHHFADPADTEREEKLETRLNEEFENPVHQFLGQLRYRTFALSRLHVRQLTRYVTLLFNRSDNRRKATKEQVAVGIESMRSLLAKQEQLVQLAERWTFEIIRLGHPLQRPVTVDEVRLSVEKIIANMQTEEHLQTTYVDSMERAMAFLDEGLDNGQWNIMHITPEVPFLIDCECSEQILRRGITSVLPVIRRYEPKGAGKVHPPSVSLPQENQERLNKAAAKLLKNYPPNRASG